MNSPTALLLPALLLLADVPPAGPDDTPPPLPNILFIITDDQSYEALGLAGRLDVDTPNLDALARRGATFVRTYNMGGWNGAICVASRAMLITGRDLWRAREVHPRMDDERAAGRLWPQYLEAAGYETRFAGKWHIPVDPAAVFRAVRNPRPGMPPDHPANYDRPRDDAPDAWDPADPAFGGFWTGGRHWTDVTADDAVAFLREAARTRDAARQSDRTPPPFFMYVAFNAPHDPRQVPREYLDRHPPGRVALPVNFLPLHPAYQHIGCGPDLRDERLAPFPRTERAVLAHRREYLACVAHLDAAVGRVLDELERTGLAPETWVFLTSDHGLAVGRHGLMGKQNMYEHSLRVPMIVAGPGVPAGLRVESPVHMQDVVPTTLEIARVPVPEHVDFQSLLPRLRTPDSDPDATPAPETPVYAAYMHLQRAVVHRGWKLVILPEVPDPRRRLELYHLDTDPDETRDLAQDPARAPRIRTLLQTFRQLQIRRRDPLEIPPLPPEIADPPAPR